MKHPAESSGASILPGKRIVPRERRGALFKKIAKIPTGLSKGRKAERENGTHTLRGRDTSGPRHVVQRGAECQSAAVSPGVTQPNGRKIGRRRATRHRSALASIRGRSRRGIRGLARTPGCIFIHRFPARRVVRARTDAAARSRRELCGWLIRPAPRIKPHCSCGPERGRLFPPPSAGGVAVGENNPPG